MNQTVFRYGLYCMIAMVSLSALHVFVLMPNLPDGSSEIAGYLTMTIAMIFIFFGIRYYRDKVNNGTLTFGQGMKLGLLISLGPALMFALFDLLYTRVINPTWATDYYARALAKAKLETPPEKWAEKMSSIEKEQEFFSDPVILFLVMFVTVLIIGVIVTIISSIALRREKKLAAH